MPGGTLITLFLDINHSDWMMQVIHAQTIEPTSVTSDYIICFVCGHLWELKFAQWQIKLLKSSENVEKYTINPFKMAKVLNVVPSW